LTEDSELVHQVYQTDSEGNDESIINSDDESSGFMGLIMKADYQVDA
jgi:hypothetical protein